MNPSSFISPRNYQAPGGIPRRLLGGVIVVVVVIAMVVYWIASGERPAVGAVAGRGHSLETAAMDSQPRGSSRSVDEAADRAAAASRPVSGVSGVAGANGGNGAWAAPVNGESSKATDRPASEALPSLRISSAPGSLPSDAWTSGGAAGALPDPGASAREMEARSADSRIYDEPLARGGSGETPGRSRSATAASEVILSGPPGLQGLPGTDPRLLEPLLSDALRRLAPPAGRDLAQREDEWQWHAGQAMTAPSPLTARPAAGRLVVEQGTVIPAVLTRRIGSDAPGVVTAIVSIDVYDTRTAQSLLLPKGSRLVGRYNNDVSTGQERLQFAFDRLILPDGSSFDLPGAVGSDVLGQAGMPADVDRHVVQRFGAALLIGVIADRVVSPRTVPSTSAYGGGLSATGQVLVNTANAELHRNESIAPTLTVPEGTRLNVEVVRDMVFAQAYAAHP